MTRDEERGIFRSAKRLGANDDQARSLLTLSCDEAIQELRILWIKTEVDEIGFYQPPLIGS